MADAFPISGQIDPKAFPFLVVQLHRRGATGSLKVEGPSYHKALYFRSGRVLFGSSNDPRDQLGAILIESGKITPEQLTDVNAKVGPGNPLAKVLADTGFVSQRELSEAARAKVERILSDVLAYTGGTFDFEDGVLPKGAVDLKLQTEKLVMAAVRRVSDRNFVLRHIDGLDAVLGPTAEMVPRLGEVESEAAGLPQQLDGRKSLKEAAAAARLEEFESAKIACGLLFLGLVERVKATVTAAKAVAKAAPVTFADVEAGNELDLGATAAQALSAEPFVTPEPEPAAPAASAPVVIPAVDADEPPPFVIGEPPPAMDKPAVSSSEIAFDTASTVAISSDAPAFVIPSAEPEPAAAPKYAPPPAVTPEPEDSPTVAIPASSPSPSSSGGFPAFEAPDSPASAGSSPLPLIMPDKNRPPRARSSAPAAEPPSAAPPPEPRASRPSKEDMAALDALLNTRSTEAPMAPIERPAAATAFTPYPRSGGGRRQRSTRAPMLVGGAAIVLGIAAGGWYYYTQVLGGPKHVAAATPTPVAVVTTTLLAAPTTTLAAAATPPPVTPSVAAATPRPAPPTAAPPTAPPVAATPRPAPPAASDPRAALRGGNYADAARGFVAQARAAGPGAAVVQLLIACSTETVQKAVDSGNASDLVILPVNFKGRDCFRLCWGVHPSAAKANAALRSVPEYFTSGGAAPKVLPVSEVVP